MNYALIPKIPMTFQCNTWMTRRMTHGKPLTPCICHHGLMGNSGDINGFLMVVIYLSLFIKIVV